MPARSGRARCAGPAEPPYSAAWAQTRRSSRCTGWATISSCSTRARLPLDLTPARRRAIADRRLGVGCDQLIVLEPPTEREADVFMRIYNPDGGEAGACGNATRCVASVLMDERKTDHVTVQTISGLLESQKTGTGSQRPAGDLRRHGAGAARLARHPGARGLRHQSHAGRRSGRCRIPSAPAWAIRTPPSSSTMPRRSRSPSSARSWSTIASFPSAPISASPQLLGEDRLRLRVWERGAGLTLACGSGACAARRGGEPARPGAAQGRGDRWRAARSPSNGCATAMC